MLSHRSLHARALRLRESVIARLLLTLILALSAVGTFQYFIVGNRVQADLIREHAAVHAADARSLELRAAAAQNNRYERPLSEVTEVLAAIAERPDTQDVARARRRRQRAGLAARRPGRRGAHRPAAAQGRALAQAGRGRARRRGAQRLHHADAPARARACCSPSTARATR